MRQTLRQTRKALAVFLHILLGLLLGLYLAVSSLFGGRRAPIVRWWHQRLLRVMGVNVTVHGQLPTNSSFVVSNHVSWLDIPVIGAQCDAHFLSKAEVADWPLIGSLARIGGTEFHQRGGGGARRLTERLIRRLVANQLVVVFPEGTTTEGSAVRRFQPRLFATAIEAERSVTPLAVRYGPDADVGTDAPYIGDDVFFAHLWRLLKYPRVQVDLTVLPAIPAQEVAELDRDTLAKRCHGAIGAAIAANPPDLKPVREPAVFSAQERSA